MILRIEKRKSLLMYEEMKFDSIQTFINHIN